MAKKKKSKKTKKCNGRGSSKGCKSSKVKKLIKLAKAGKISKKMFVKDTLPFVPTILLGYILCLALGDFWLILIGGLI